MNYDFRINKDNHFLSFFHYVKRKKEVGIF